MRSMKKLVCLVLALSLVFTLGLSGCGSNNDKDANASTAAGTAAGTDSTQPASTEAAKSDTPVELVIWGDPTHSGEGFKAESEMNATQKPVMDAVKQEMEAKYPGIKLKYVDKGWADTLRQNLMLATMAGNGPDAACGEDFIPEFAKIGALMEVPEDITKNLAEGPIIAGKYEGKNYAVSGMSGIFALCYNRAVLKAAGLTENDVPKTWDQWLTVSKKITDAGKGKFWGTVVQNNQLGGAFRLSPFMRQAGGDFTSADWSQVTFNSPANLKALTFIRELAKTTPPGSTALNDEGKLFTMVNEGKACFCVQGPWMIAWGEGEPTKADLGFAPLPLPDGGKTGNVIVGNCLWFGLKQSKNPEATLEFLRVMAGEKYQKIEALTNSRLPSNKTVEADPEIAKAIPDMAIFGQILTSEPAGPLPVYTKNGPKIWEAWYKAQDVTLLSDKPIDAALAEAQKTAEELLK